MKREIIIPRHVAEIPTEVSISDAAEACAKAGYGNSLPDDYSDSEPVLVSVNGISGVMPKWMAEVFGHIGRARYCTCSHTDYVHIEFGHGKCQAYVFPPCGCKAFEPAPDAQDATTPAAEEAVTPERIWISPTAFLARSAHAVIYDEAGREPSDLEYILRSSADAKAEKLREALRPFAEAGIALDKPHTIYFTKAEHERAQINSITTEDLRAAAAALLCPQPCWKSNGQRRKQRKGKETK